MAAEDIPRSKGGSGNTGRGRTLTYQVFTPFYRRLGLCHFTICGYYSHCNIQICMYVLSDGAHCAYFTDLRVCMSL